MVIYKFKEIRFLSLRTLVSAYCKYNEIKFCRIHLMYSLKYNTLQISLFEPHSSLGSGVYDYTFPNVLFKEFFNQFPAYLIKHKNGEVLTYHFISNNMFNLIHFENWFSKKIKRIKQFERFANLTKNESIFET